MSFFFEHEAAFAVRLSLVGSGSCIRGRCLLAAFPTVASVLKTTSPSPLARLRAPLARLRAPMPRPPSMPVAASTWVPADDATQAADPIGGTV